MHYYKKNIGDYAKKAGRLSMLQHGAYTLLIDACYDREQFPTLEEAIDWSWASSKEEIEAVTFVLLKFFDLIDNVYIQKRVKEELETYHKNAATNKRIANERETNRKDKVTKRERTVDDSIKKGNEAPPNHKPLTINHIKKSKPKKETQKRFIKPTVWQVAEYCQERKNKVDFEKWIDYYMSNGWKVGKNSMRNWKAAVRTWERNDENNASKKTAKGNEQKIGYADRLASLDL